MNRRNPIEKGLLPLLDISMLLFGLLIIILTYAKFQEAELITEKEDSVSIGISLAMQDDTEQSNSDDIKSDSAELVEELVKDALSQNKLIMLFFNLNGVVNYKEQILYDGEFNKDVLDDFIKDVIENKSKIIVSYPETAAKTYSKVNANLIIRFKNEIEKYTDSIFFIGNKLEEN